MSRRLRRLIENQPKVKVATQTQNDVLNKSLVSAFAVIVAGVFYFFGYYFFAGILWRVLSGG